MYGEGSTYNSIEYKMRPLRKLSLKLVAEEANGDSNVAMNPSPDGPRIRPSKITKAKPNSKNTATKNTRATQASEGALTQSLIDDDGVAESDANDLIVIGEPVHINSDIEEGATTKIKEKDASAEGQYTRGVRDRTTWFKRSELDSSFKFDQELIKDEKSDGDGAGNADVELKFAPTWPDKSWFKEENEA
ncbi:hypothetical protein N7523_006429 [Penicillium sp. IBT 18751x]|nr:hypothetical protein N7523_006429 [Penicillium sp. IBT 18751x]